MKFAIENKDDLIRMYINEEKTSSDIARFYNTYKGKIVRALNFLGVKMRDRSENYKLLDKQNKHPKRGRKVSDEGRDNMSNAIIETWKNKETREARSQGIKKSWDEVSEQNKQEKMSSLRNGLRASARNGSKWEEFVVYLLDEWGYKYEQHVKSLQNEKLEIDILLTKYPIVIEVDGPMHYLPVFGEDKLLKTIAQDTQKNGIVIGLKYSMIRLRVPTGFMSIDKKDFVVEQLRNAINEIIFKSKGEPKLIITERYS